jgi:hypothetical protein
MGCQVVRGQRGQRGPAGLKAKTTVPSRGTCAGNFTTFFWQFLPECRKMAKYVVKTIGNSSFVTGFFDVSYFVFMVFLYRSRLLCKESGMAFSSNETKTESGMAFLSNGTKTDC